MRASIYLVGFAAASMAGAGLVGMGCSSSSSTPNTTPEASTGDDSGGSSGGSSSGGSSSGGAEDAAACVATGIDVEILDGGSQWSCLQTACKASLTPCAAECSCNNAVLGSLLCSADGGDPTTCFGPLETDDALAMAVISCLATETASSGTCPTGGTSTPDGSTDGAADGGTPSDAATAGQ